MINILTGSIIRLVQRFCMILTLGCCVYVIVSLFSKSQDMPISENTGASHTKGVGLLSPAPVFDLKPYNVSADSQVRDIFSMDSLVSPSGAVENTPKGQLPNHLKIVGILIAYPSQIIIEDSFANKTFFIQEGNPQDGIKIVRVSKDQMIINYMGEDIPVSIKKD